MGRMPIKATSAAALAVVALAAPAAAGANQIPSAVFVDGYTDHYFNFEGSGTLRRAPNGYDLFGRVEAPSRKCRVNRRVTAYQLNPTEGQPPIKLGVDPTSSAANWSVYLALDDFDFDGTFFAKIQKRKLRNGDVCKADRSANVEFIF